MPQHASELGCDDTKEFLTPEFPYGERQIPTDTSTDSSNDPSAVAARNGALNNT